MNKVLLLCVCLLAGCTTTRESAVSQNPAPKTSAELSRQTEISRISGMQRRFLSLRQINEGMSRKDVKNAIGNPIIVGYELRDTRSGSYRPITVDNPYRTEIFEKGTQKYEIDYYLVGIRDADDKVSDSELIPLVYLKDKLIGTGWIYLNRELKSQ